MTESKQNLDNQLNGWGERGREWTRIYHGSVYKSELIKNQQIFQAKTVCNWAHKYSPYASMIDIWVELSSGSLQIFKEMTNIEYTINLYAL